MTDIAVKVSRLGLRGWLIEPEVEPCIAVQQRLWALADRLAASDEVAEVVPGVGNLLVVRKDPPPSTEAWTRALTRAWRDAPPEDREGRAVRLPVRYGGALREDLIAVADRTGLDAMEVVRLHAAKPYRVYCIASSPGYGYLFGLDPRLAVPRKATPRASVPVGAICIAGRQTGVTVVDGPNGWHVIGHTTVPMFDIARANPSLLGAGDTVHFDIVDIDL